MNPETILAAAKAATPKVRLEEYREAVQELRDKGFTWREIADFLKEQGVQTDHTRLYRTFGHPKQKRKTESRDLEISRMTYVGQKITKRKKTWNVIEIELPSRLGRPITVLGYVWGTGTAKFVLGEENAIGHREARLIMKTGSSFPMAYITAELQAEGDYWSPQEIYIVPKWDALL